MTGVRQTTRSELQFCKQDVLDQTNRRVRGKKVGGDGQVKFKNGEKSILGRWSWYFSESLNPKGNTLSMEEVVLAIQSLRSKKSVTVDEIWPEMLKVLGE